MLIEMSPSEAIAAHDALARSLNARRARKTSGRKMGALSSRAMEMATMKRAIDTLHAAIDAHTAEMVAEIKETTT